MELNPVKDKYRADKIILGKRYNFDWYFNNIFDKETFPEKNYLLLARSCSKYFKQWFDKETFPKEYYWSLNKHCQKYKHIWNDGGEA